MSKEREEKEKDPFPGPAPISIERKKKFMRAGKKHGGNPAFIRDKKLKGMMYNYEKKTFESVNQAARCDILMTEDAGFLETEEGEESWKITQEEICKQVDITSRSKHFKLDLNQFGPYTCDYTRNGRHLVLGGKRGHLLAVDWQPKKMHFEINVMEQINDVKFLHSENMVAVAQKKWTYIYDNQGTELHCMKDLHAVNKMQFLPYHFLLATASRTSRLQYLDISVGKLVSDIRTKRGPLEVMSHNPHNAIVLLGHHSGRVSMWSPNMKEPVAEMFSHFSNIQSIAVDREGRYIATAGGNRKLKIFDIRTFKPLHTYSKIEASNLQFSQRGLLAASCQNKTVRVYRDPCTQVQEHPYLTHKCNTEITSLAFCPYEDVLAVGKEDGFVSLLIPGAGEANLDGFESNPMRNKKQRREWEVKALLDKIPHDLISLDTSNIHKLDLATHKQVQEDQIKRLGYKPEEPKFEPRYKKKGKSKSGHVERRKNIELEKKRRAQVVEKNEQKRLKVEQEKQQEKLEEEKKEDEPSFLDESSDDEEVEELIASSPSSQPLPPQPSSPAKYSALNRFKK